MKELILIMEDDPFTQQFYSYLFKRSNYEIVITDNGDKFFETLDSKPVVLIILDINLKNTYIDNEKVDGVMISRMIKRDEKKSHIPILLVTAYQNKVNGRDFIEESLADDYILKPIVDFEDLLNKIERLKTRINGTR